MDTGPRAAAVLEALERALDSGDPSVILSIVHGLDDVDTSVLTVHDIESELSSGSLSAIRRQWILSASSSLVTGRNAFGPVDVGTSVPTFACLPIKRPLHLHVFGAGDDAQPLVRFAAELGWQVTVADGRSHLLVPARFPQAKHLQKLEYETRSDVDHFGAPQLVQPLTLSGPAIAVLLTHSYQQDYAILKSLLQRDTRYLGILGPLHRTQRLIAAIAPAIGKTEAQCLSRIHAPVGVNIGADTPALIALAIVAQIQGELVGSSRTNAETGMPRQSPRQEETLIASKESRYVATASVAGY